MGSLVWFRVQRPGTILKFKIFEFVNDSKNMERIQSKCEELLNILPYVQCHDCKDVPGPCRKTRNRYSCVDGSHVLCENHKEKCPCGSLVVKNPSMTIAKMLENLPW